MGLCERQVLKRRWQWAEGDVWVRRGKDGVCTVLEGRGRLSGDGHATPSSSCKVPDCPSHRAWSPPQMAVSPSSQGPPHPPGHSHTLDVGATSAHPTSCVPFPQPSDSPRGRCSQYATPRLHIWPSAFLDLILGDLVTTEFGGQGLRSGAHSLEISWVLEHPGPWAQVSPNSIPS